MTSRNSAEEMLIALRKVIRAIDLHSRQLVLSHGLTGPQALVLKQVVEFSSITSGELAKQVSLSQATITDIVKRLESRQLLLRKQSQKDRRRVHVQATELGCNAVAASPPLLQETFSKRFNALKDWEQNLLLSSVQRVAELMDAEELDAAPLLSSGSVSATPEAVSEMISPSESKE